jgi:hypothetical protein
LNSLNSGVAWLSVAPSRSTLALGMALLWFDAGPGRQRERDALICVPSHDHWPDAVEVGRRHAEHFRALAEPADLSLRSPGQNEWLERLQTEAGNLAAIVNWYLAHDLGPLPHLFGSCGKFGRGAPVSVRPVRGSSNSCPPPACWTRRTGSNCLGHGCACRLHELAAMRRRARTIRARCGTLGIPKRQIAEYALRSDDEFALAERRRRASYGAVPFAAVAVLGWRWPGRVRGHVWDLA